MFEGVLKRGVGDLLFAFAAEWTSGSGQPDFGYLIGSSSSKALEHARVFAIHRYKSAPGTLRRLFHHQFTGKAQHLFAGESNGFAAPQRFDDRTYSGNSDDGAENYIHILTGGDLNEGFISCFDLYTGSGKGVFQLTALFYITGDGGVGSQQFRRVGKFIYARPCGDGNCPEFIAVFSKFNSGTRTDGTGGSEYRDAFG
jgi:hypothetical protein